MCDLIKSLIIKNIDDIKKEILALFDCFKYILPTSFGIWKKNVFNHWWAQNKDKSSWRLYIMK